MKKVEKKNTFADKIAGFLNTVPSNFHPEDEEIDATNARVPQIFPEEAEDEEDEAPMSQFRRANVELLADFDEKYAGKKTSRKQVKESDSEEADEEIGESDSGEEGEEISEDDATSEEEEEEKDSSEDVEDDSNFKHMAETNVSNQIKKGICVRNQMAAWESLLEMRIQLQKCVLTANKMPPAGTLDEMKKDSEFSSKVKETKATLSAALDKFLVLQKLVKKKFPETKNLGQQTEQNDEDDEEIPSDTEEEESASEDGDEEERAVHRGKKRKLDEYEKEISKQYKTYKDYSNTVIQKWNNKTRIAIKDNSSSHSILDQIEYNLRSREKLIKRTQMRRSQYTILGQEPTDDEHHPEIFDDDDFYHQLLRELIEVKSADVTDPVQLGRQWIQLQNLRSKMKRKVDTKATKGRKIRYAIHSKLVNFMAPIDENLWTDEAKNELYNSLFGKNQPGFHA